MKKFLALILSVAMIFALVACGSKEGDTPNTDGDTQQTDTHVRKRGGQHGTAAPAQHQPEGSHKFSSKRFHSCLSP